MVPRLHQPHRPGLTALAECACVLCRDQKYRSAVLSAFMHHGKLCRLFPLASCRRRSSACPLRFHMAWERVQVSEPFINFAVSATGIMCFSERSADGLYSAPERQSDHHPIDTHQSCTACLLLLARYTSVNCVSVAARRLSSTPLLDMIRMTGNATMGPASTCAACYAMMDHVQTI